MSEAGPSRPSHKLDRQQANRYRPLATGAVGSLDVKLSPVKGKATESWTNPLEDGEYDSRDDVPRRRVSTTLTLQRMKRDSYSPEKRDDALPSRPFPTGNKYDTSPPQPRVATSPLKYDLPGKPSASGSSVSARNGNGGSDKIGRPKSPSGASEYNGQRSDHEDSRSSKRAREEYDRHQSRVSREPNGRQRDDRDDGRRGQSRERQDRDSYRGRSRSREGDRNGTNHTRGDDRYEPSRDYRDRRDEYARYDSKRDGRYSDSYASSSHYSSDRYGGYEDNRSSRYNRYDDRDQRSRDDRLYDDRSGRRRDDTRDARRDTDRWEDYPERHSADTRRRTISDQSRGDRYESQGSAKVGGSYRPDDSYEHRSDRSRQHRSSPAPRPRSPSAEEGEISDHEVSAAPPDPPSVPDDAAYTNGSARHVSQPIVTPSSPASHAEPYSRPKIVRPTHRRPTPPRSALPNTPPPPPPPEDEAPPTPPAPPAEPAPPPGPSIPTGPRNPNRLLARPKTPPLPVENPYLVKHLREEKEKRAAEETEARRKAREADRAARHAAEEQAKMRMKFSRRTLAQEEELYGRTFRGITTMEDYEMAAKIGEGTFGVVTRAKEKVGGRAVALKKLIAHNLRDGVSVTTVREIKILKSLNHDNVVPLLSMVVRKDDPNDRSKRGEVFMVFPYMDHDLCGLLANPAFKLNLPIAKLFMRQLLEGIAFIHASNFIHRDIKTANILVDRRGQAMIADFGLARSYTPDEDMPVHAANEYTNMVVTRWYRAPELLLGACRYTQAVDLWSAGCIMGELYHKQPILAGHSDHDQLHRIMATCGPLNDQSWPTWRELPGFPDHEGEAWDKVLPEMSMADMARKVYNIDKLGTALFMRLLTLDPAQRISAEDALDDIWFHVSPLPAVITDDLIKVESSHEMNIKRPEPPQAHQPRPRQSQIPPQNLFPQSQSHAHVPHMNGSTGPYGSGPVAGVPMSHMPPHGQAPMSMPSGMPPQYGGQPPFPPGPGYQPRPPMHNPYAPPVAPPNPYDPSAYPQQLPGNPYGGGVHHSMPPRPTGLPPAPHQQSFGPSKYHKSTGLPPSSGSRPPTVFKLAGGIVAPQLTGGHRNVHGRPDGSRGPPNGPAGLPGRPPPDHSANLNYDG